MNPRQSDPLAIGKDFLKKRQFEKAFNVFKKITDSYPQNLDALLGLAEAYSGLDQHVSAIITLDKVFEIEKNNAKADKILSDIHSSIGKKIATETKQYANTNTKKSKTNYSNLVFFLKDNINVLFLDSKYLDKFDDLCSKHDKNIQSSFANQVNWVLECMEFIYQYLDNSQTNYFTAFINPIFFQKTEQAQHLQYKKCSLPLTSTYFAEKIAKGNAKYFFDNELSRLTTTVADEIMRDHLKVVLRMIFETIHKFPREERGKLTELIPWNQNSWYYFEFIGAVFFSKAKNEVGLYLNASHSGLLNATEKKYLNSFYDSVGQYGYLVKIAETDLVQTDLKAMRAFFKGLKSHLDAKEVANFNLPMGELPNLTILLHYYKQVFNSYRLTAILPTHDKLGLRFLKTTSTISDTNKLGNVFTEESIKHSLSWRLTILRMIIKAGEDFSSRSMLDRAGKINFINYESLIDSRNGFLHIEDLSSASVLNTYENNVGKIMRIAYEGVMLKRDYQKYLAASQQELGEWPDTNFDSNCVEMMGSYWTKVKQVLAPEKPFEATFAPNENLLAEAQIQEILVAIRLGSPVRAKLESKLRGREPYNQIGIQFIEEHLIPVNEINPNLDEDGTKKAKRARRKKIGDWLSVADKQYKNLKLIAKNNRNATNKKNAKDNQAQKDQAMQTIYLEIDMLGKTMFTLQASDIRMSKRSLVSLLQDRITSLTEVLAEHSITLDLSRGIVNKLEKLADEKFELSGALTYLTPQIISLMDILFSHGVLKDIHENLGTRLTDYLALRNAIAHPDSVKESSDFSYFSMIDNLSKPIAYFTCEMILLYKDAILAVNLNTIDDQTMTARATSALVRVKQEKVLSDDCFGEIYLLSAPQARKSAPKLTSPFLALPFKSTSNGPGTFLLFPTLGSAKTPSQPSSTSPSSSSSSPISSSTTTPRERSNNKGKEKDTSSNRKFSF